MIDLVSNTVMLDTETMGLSRGAGVRELAIFDESSQVLHQWIVSPHIVETRANPRQEWTRLATDPRDTHQLIRVKNWIESARRQLATRGLINPGASDDETLKVLGRVDPWLRRQFDTDPLLRGGKRDDLQVRKHVKDLVVNYAEPSELLAAGHKSRDLLKTRIIWGANIGFDSKQLGAVMAGAGVTDFKTGLETWSPGGDPLYVTGKEVQEARMRASQTQDWTQVWQTYKLPHRGTAVRDITDVLRASYSYGQKLGLLSGSDPYFGASMDLSYRLFTSVEAQDADAARAALLTAESHFATEDVAITQRLVRDRALEMVQVLEQVYEGTPQGLEWQDQAVRGEGPLTRAQMYFARLETLRPELQRINLIKRLGRAWTDIAEQGVTWQNDGLKAIEMMRQQTASGKEVDVARGLPNRRAFKTMDELTQWLTSQERYRDVDVAGAMGEIQSRISGVGSVKEQQRLIGQYIDSLSLEETIKSKIDDLLQVKPAMIKHGLGRGGAKGLAGLSQIAPGTGRAILLGAAALTGAGAVWSMTAGNATPTRTEPSLVTYNYQQWLRHQQQFYGQTQTQEGLAPGGVNEKLRHIFTDFGSPYQGPQGSHMVFMDLKLQEEREKYLREQFYLRHMDPEQGLLATMKIISRARHLGYSYIQGEQVQRGYRGLRGQNLQKIDLKDWSISVEDADTITLRRRGILGSVTNALGLGKTYSFRLAGIDAPEVGHGDVSSGRYRPDQPYGQEAIAQLRKILQTQNDLELVIDPTQTTYGRTMGVLFSGAKNVNYELVKQGSVAHLAYGKYDESMISYAQMARMEGMAVAAGRGMWQHPFFKAFHDATAAGESLTFNTLTSAEKLAKNVGQMNLASLMWNAQDTGRYTPIMASEASRIGRHLADESADLLPRFTEQVPAHYKAYMDELLNDQNTWMRTKGTQWGQNRFSTKGNYGKLDQHLVLDSFNSTTSVMNRRRFEAFEAYALDKRKAINRRAFQAAQQRHVNQHIFDSPIGHHAM